MASRESSREALPQSLHVGPDEVEKIIEPFATGFVGGLECCNGKHVVSGEVEAIADALESPDKIAVVGDEQGVTIPAKPKVLMGP